MLHEACHALGFASAIDSNGFSKFGQNNNYFTGFDKFLTDPSGNPLLTSTVSGCNTTGLTFQGQPTLIANGCNSATPAGITNCSLACRFIDSYANTAVYTPGCYSSGSTFSHFEDMCSFGAFTSSCIPTPTSPGYNDLFYVMSDALATGGCYIKRYLQEVERYVLCDLGYSVNTTYSIAGSAVKTYSAGNCNPVNVIGVNDGINGNAYTFVTTGTAVVINYTTILNNDIPNTGLTVSCMQSIYNTATVAPGMTNFTVTSTSGGLALIRYLPANGSGQIGNATYIYVFFSPGNCSPVNPCNMINNGGFESTSGQPCHDLPASNVDCWTEFHSSPDLHTRSCTAIPSHNLGTNVNFVTSPPIDSWNGAPNNKIIWEGMFGFSPNYGCETVKNALSSPLIPGQTYQLSFMAMNYSGPAAAVNPNSGQNPLVISAASSPSFAIIPTATSYPTGLNVFAEYTLNATPNPSWTACTSTFVFNSPGNLNHSTFHIGVDGFKSSLLGPPLSGGTGLYIDDFSLLPMPTVTFAIPSNTVFAGSTYTNLAQYASSVPGSFSGPGVSASTNSSGTVFSFNASQTLSPGSYPVGFTYTVNGCTNTLFQNITVFGINTNYVSPCISSYTLSANGFNSNATFTWLPGNMNTQTVIVNPTVTTIYTLMASNGTNSASYTISLNTLTVVPVTFTNLPSQLCIGQSDIILDYLLATGVPTNGAWSGPLITNSVIGGNTVSIFPISTNSLITPGVNTIYYSYAIPGVTLCYPGSSFNVSVFPSSFTLSGANINYCNNIQPNISLSVTPNPPSLLSYSWQPGNFNGQAITINPSTSTIYTISAVGGTCSSGSTTLSVSVFSNCCSPTLTAFTATSIPASAVLSFTSPTAWMNSFTLQANQSLTLHLSEFIMAPNVKITVNPTATLNIFGSHIYACGSNMWNGIEVLNGGKLFLNRSNDVDNLIEDAKIAIDITSNTLTTNILESHYTTFNKNHIDISISGYQQTVNPYPFIIDNCIFTCRDLPFSYSIWPQASSVSTTTFDLRHVTSPTTNLTPPYLGQNNFSITTLKKPYSNEPSSIAIKLSSVGLSSGTNTYGIQIGSNSSPIDFNLFDAHGKFIDATNTNLKLFNNVFQNTRTYVGFAIPNFTSTAIFALYGGYAIDYNITNNTLGILDLSAASINTGNKFWNCHTGINCKNVFKFNIQNALFRSTQSSTLTSSSTGLVGQTGINLNTNRFFYYIGRNEFTNIRNSINIPVAANLLPTGLVSGCSTCIWGVYGVNMAIEQNTFSPVTSGTNFGNNYSNRAISITCPNNNPIYLAPAGQYSPAFLGIYVSRNKINNVFRGIKFLGLSGIKTAIADNDITLRDDIINTSSPQAGIELQNHLGTSNYQAQASITSNTLTGQNTTNTFVSLVDCIMNAGLESPSVTCNQLSNAGNGFLFNSTNDETIWQGNEMTNLGRGLMLDNAGVIGHQGDINTASNNKWLGSTWTGTLSQTYIGANTVPSLSLLYVKTTPSLNPSINNGVNPGIVYGSANTLSTSTGGDYQCGGAPNNFVIPLPDINNYIDANDYYIAQTSFYRFLHHNDSVRNSGGNYNSFYTILQSSNVGLFNDVEEKLFIGDFAQASSINNSITPSNIIETNYKLYYNLYISYYTAGSWNVDDSTDLYDLTQLCPGDEGACVLQARALYNSIYNTVLIYPMCGAAGSKSANNDVLGYSAINKVQNWEVFLFPNPTKNELTLTSNKENEILKIFIKDLRGRQLKIYELQTHDNKANISLDLINGFYFVTIVNSKNESITKKLLITK
jgi:hypothetical protein